MFQRRKSALGAAMVLMLLAPACASGRVSGGQGTEMAQEEAYDPSNAANPPTGNTDFNSGPIKAITPPPVLQVDLERRRPPTGPPLEPEPEPQSNPEPQNDPR
jgi:hypothetical protein